MCPFVLSKSTFHFTYNRIQKWNSDCNMQKQLLDLVSSAVLYYSRHSFLFLAKELLEPIRPISECLQGRLQEVYFGFKKITEIMKHYKTLRENVHTEHNRIYGKALLLSTEIDSERHNMFKAGECVS